MGDKSIQVLQTGNNMPRMRLSLRDAKCGGIGDKWKWAVILKLAIFHVADTATIWALKEDTALGNGP